MLFPRAVLPLHIFEPRYRAMLAHCLSTHGAIVIARVTDERDIDAEGKRPASRRIAGLGVIADHRALPDGRSNILVLGKARVAIDELPSDTPYRRVRARVLDDVRTKVVREVDRTALVTMANTFARRIEPHANVELVFPADAPPEVVADLCAQHLVLDPDAKQAVLEERDIAARVRRVTAELAIQLARFSHGDGSATLN